MSFVCIICLDRLSNNDGVDRGRNSNSRGPVDTIRGVDIVATKCGHLYHMNCLRDWITRDASARTAHECPYCKAGIGTHDYQKIYPVGDEDAGNMERKLIQAKLMAEESAVLRSELSQFEKILEQTGTQLEEKKLAYENLQFAYQEKSIELESLMDDQKEQQKSLEILKNHFESTLEKLLNDNKCLHDELQKSKQLFRLSALHSRAQIRFLEDQLVSARKTNAAVRTVGSQTDTLPISIDSIPASISPGEILELCIRYLESSTGLGDISVGKEEDDENRSHKWSPIIESPTKIDDKLKIKMESTVDCSEVVSVLSRRKSY